jgi:hypothetical protein
MRERIIKSVKLPSPEDAANHCVSPELGELVPEYIAGLLAESIEEEIEDHLLSCRQCRESFLKINQVMDAARAGGEGFFNKATEGYKANGRRLRLVVPTTRKSDARSD